MEIRTFQHTLEHVAVYRSALPLDVTVCFTSFPAVPATDAPDVHQVLLTRAEALDLYEKLGQLLTEMGVGD